MGFRERRELSDDSIRAMGRAVQQNDPALEYGAFNLRNTFARRKGEEEEKNKQRIIGKEITYGKDSYDKDGVNRMRLVRDNFYIKLQLGIRYKDKPREFTVQRQLVITPEEFPLALGLLNALANKPQPKK